MMMLLEELAYDMKRHVDAVPSVAVTMTQDVLERRETAMQETSCLITANVRMDSSASQSC